MPPANFIEIESDPYMDPRGTADYAGNLLAAVLSSAGK
jgi:hypothetical protein